MDKPMSRSEGHGPYGHRAADVGLLVRFTQGSLEERTRATLAAFDSETQDYAFNDSGDGTTYALLMADLLDEWLDRGGIPGVTLRTEAHVPERPGQEHQG